MGFRTAPGAMISVQVDINHNKWVSVNPGGYEGYGRIGDETL